MDEDTKKQLAKIFYAKGIFMRNVNNFINAVRKAGLDIPSEQIKEFYKNQTIVQVFKKRPMRLIPKLHDRITTQSKLFRKIYGDSMTFTDDRTKNKFALIAFMDGFSKYGYAYYVPLKSSTTDKVSINDGIDALYEFLDLLQDKFNVSPDDFPENEKQIFITDAGNEFASPFVDELRREGISHRYAEAGDTLKNPLIERFNYTLRLMIEKFRTTYDVDNQQDVVKRKTGTKIEEPREPKTIDLNQRQINYIVDKYNNLPSKALGGLTPLEATEEENKRKLNEFYRNRKLQRMTRLKITHPDNSWVRISLKKIGDPFAKTLRQNWTVKVYKVQKYDKKRNRYKVNDVYYLAEELQPVDKEALDEYDMFNKIVKDPESFAKDLDIPRKERQLSLEQVLSRMDINQFHKYAVITTGFGQSKNLFDARSTITHPERLEKTAKFLQFTKKKQQKDKSSIYTDLLNSSLEDWLRIYARPFVKTLPFKGDQKTIYQDFLNLSLSDFLLKYQGKLPPKKSQGS